MAIVIFIIIGLGILLLVSATAGTGSNVDSPSADFGEVDSTETRRLLRESQQQKLQERSRNQSKKPGQTSPRFSKPS